MTDTKTIANTILQQLGGRMFVMMTGAKDLIALGGDGGLQFKLPRFPGLPINLVRVILLPNDTYRVEFCRHKPSKLQVIVDKVVSDVYATDLRHVFTETTGLDCTMGAIRR